MARLTDSCFFSRFRNQEPNTDDGRDQSQESAQNYAFQVGPNEARERLPSPIRPPPPVVTVKVIARNFLAALIEGACSYAERGNRHGLDDLPPCVFILYSRTKQGS